MHDNIRIGTNPPFTVADFRSIYPHFGDDVIPEVILQMYIDLAQASIQQARWRDSWKIAMGWFIAHFATLYIQSITAANSPAAQVIAAGQAAGLTTSESAGDVSVSIDHNAIAQDLDGWAAWKLTIFGQQLATMGRLVGKGGMYVR